MSMPIKKKLSFILSVLIINAMILIIFIQYDYTASDDFETNHMDNTGISLSTIATDFTITDVSSSISYNLSDFTGKIVAIQFFATYCPDCVDELPYLRELYMMYPEDMLQIISITVDRTEPTEIVHDFRRAHQMDWIVAIDVTGQIGSDYNVVLKCGTGIPYVLLLDETQNIVWEQIDISPQIWTEMLATFALYLPADDTNPEINSFEYVIGEELSVFYTEIHIEANISEDRNVKNCFIKAITIANEKEYLCELIKNGKFFYLDKSIFFVPSFLYGINSIDLELKVTDYFGNSNTTTISDITVQGYEDATPPEIDYVEYEIIEVNKDVFKINVIAKITDDLLLLEANVTFLKDETQIDSVELKSINNTHYQCEQYFDYDEYNPEEITLKILAKDVSSKTSTMEIDIEVEKSGYSMMFSMLSLMLLSVISATIITRKKNHKHH